MTRADISIQLTADTQVRANVAAYQHIDHDNEPPIDIELGLTWCDLILSRLGGTSLASLKILGPGACDDCDNDQPPAHRRRYLYGARNLELCRRHATARARCRP